MSDEFAKAEAVHRAGRPDLALPVYRATIAGDPDHAQAHHLLAVACLQTGQAAEAEALARRAVLLSPGQGRPLNTLGNVLAALGRPLEALEAFTQAGLADSFLNAGVILAGLKRHDDAVTALRRAEELAPDDPRPLVSLSAQLVVIEHFDEALAAAKRALALAPDNGGALLNLGLALARLGRPAEAIEAFAQAAAAGQDSAGLHAAWGHALKATGDLAGAIERFRKAIDRDPSDANPFHALLTSLACHDRVTAKEVMDEYRRFGRLHEPPLAARRRAFGPQPNSDRVLRIAYLAPNLGDHVLAQNIKPVLAHHHRDRVHVSVYAHVPKPDRFTAEMQELADDWTFIHTMSDDAVAERIRTDRIDVLVHPMGHWADGRVLVLARKPAPVIVNYLNNSASSGLDAVDATLIDGWLDDDGRVSALSIERPIRLASGFQVTQYDSEPEIGPPPCLANGFVTFASFNNPVKISDQCLDSWAEVLRAVPDSRLLIKGAGATSREWRSRLEGGLAGRGIVTTRIELVDRLPGHRNHLEAFNRVDIQLDTMPFTGGRTSEDALWMGVPVVTLAGDGVWARYTKGHLGRIGHSELVARDKEGYAALARDLAGDPRRLIAYRAGLRQAMKASSIMDFDAHCAELEEVFLSLWRERMAWEGR